mgnify:CR=1 FL=1
MEDKRLAVGLEYFQKKSWTPFPFQVQTWRDFLDGKSGLLNAPTGSGKTLTSFKAARLATELEFIDKVFFVVDRKDLDYQTMKEYQRFAPDSVNGSDSTADLKRNLELDDNKIVVGVIDNFKAKGEFTKNEPAFFQLMWPRSEEGKIVLKLKSGTDANFEAKLVKDLGSMLVGWTVEVSYLTDQRQNQPRHLRLKTPTIIPYFLQH